MQSRSLISCLRMFRGMFWETIQKHLLLDMTRCTAHANLGLSEQGKGLGRGKKGGNGEMMC